MSTKIVPLETQQERIAELISAAKDYAQARARFEAISNRLERALSATCPMANQLVDELDVAADAVGREQTKTADLVYAIVADGFGEALGTLLTFELGVSPTEPFDSTCS